jgi:hypothetical protein
MGRHEYFFEGTTVDTESRSKDGFSSERTELARASGARSAATNQ